MIISARSLPFLAAAKQDFWGPSEFLAVSLHKVSLSWHAISPLRSTCDTLSSRSAFRNFHLVTRRTCGLGKVPFHTHPPRFHFRGGSYDLEKRPCTLRLVVRLRLCLRPHSATPLATRLPNSVDMRRWPADTPRSRQSQAGWCHHHAPTLRPPAPPALYTSRYTYRRQTWISTGTWEAGRTGACPTCSAWEEVRRYVINESDHTRWGFSRMILTIVWGDRAILSAVSWPCRQRVQTTRITPRRMASTPSPSIVSSRRSRRKISRSLGPRKT